MENIQSTSNNFPKSQLWTKLVISLGIFLISITIFFFNFINKNGNHLFSATDTSIDYELNYFNERGFKIDTVIGDLGIEGIIIEKKNTTIIFGLDTISCDVTINMFNKKEIVDKNMIPDSIINLINTRFTGNIGILSIEISKIRNDFKQLFLNFAHRTLSHEIELNNYESLYITRNYSAIFTFSQKKISIIWNNFYPN